MILRTKLHEEEARDALDYINSEIDDMDMDTREAFIPIRQALKEGLDE